MRELVYYELIPSFKEFNMRVKEIKWYLDKYLLHKEVPVSGVCVLIPSEGDTVIIDNCTYITTEVIWNVTDGVVKIQVKL